MKNKIENKIVLLDYAFAQEVLLRAEGYGVNLNNKQLECIVKKLVHESDDIWQEINSKIDNFIDDIKNNNED